MAYDPEQTRTVSVRVRRVVHSRIVRRLLVLVGIAITGWLIGGAQAHADEVPATGAPGIVAPVQGQASNGPRSLLRATASAVRGAAAKVGTTTTAGTAKKVLPAPLPALAHKVDGAVAGVDTPAPRTPNGVSWVRPRTAKMAQGARAQQHGATAAKRAHKAHRHAGQAPARVGSPRPVPAPAAPFQDPSQAVSSAPASGVVLLTGFGGPISRWSWAGARPQPILMTALGAVPPAVRSAADEPSFAPD
ncbi:hypothetical protein J4573_31315 [Actinomadura barringtoniae]|uniref:Uncharacterized protein n=1 Tax=Actinomadura barringtoniae TaxID=1427535 RepID=A0A939PEY9_9ACTN|nr:hypothetical protein [Actinomadura barringtoniae]MBO2451617.1 hypothetical protein [Actinomadura barringtoniae]